MRVGITGASGLLGTALAPALEAQGHEVWRFVRGTGQAPSERTISWDPAGNQLDPAAVAPLDAVVHLAGENLAEGRWTDERKHRILASRVDGTSLVARTIASLDRKPVLLSASGVGYYGDAGIEPLDETAPRGQGFLAEVCEAWEAATEPAADAGARVVVLRMGVVLSKAGGALAKMLLPFKLGLGGRIGTGHQWMSWVVLDDVLRVMSFALEHERLAGAVNVAAPNPVQSSELTTTLARVLSRPSIMPLPAFAVRAMFGEMGEQVLLAGQRVLPTRLEREGFRFDYHELEPALRHVLGR